MKSLMTVLALMLATTAHAQDGIRVTYTDVVKPDAEFRIFMDGFEALIIGKEGHDFMGIDAMFAPTVKTFLKRELPSEPFNPTADITSDYLLKAADTLAGRERFTVDSTDENRRVAVIYDALTDIGIRHPFGTIAEAPGMICANAPLSYDRRAVAKFSRMHKVRIDDLVFFDEEIILYKLETRKSEVVAIVPPYTIMVGEGGYQPYDEWHKMISSTGVKGFSALRAQPQSIAAQHVCFGKINGQYRITTILGYKP